MDCSGMIFSLIEEAASTGAVYSFALNGIGDPVRTPCGISHGAYST
jgi:hypothetical protein